MNMTINWETFSFPLSERISEHTAVKEDDEEVYAGADHHA